MVFCIAFFLTFQSGIRFKQSPQTIACYATFVMYRGFLMYCEREEVLNHMTTRYLSSKQWELLGEMGE